MRLWMSNIDPDITDEDIINFFEKYTRTLPEKIDRVEGDGSHPAAVLYFPHHDQSTALEFSNRLNGMFWNNRALTVEPLPPDPTL